MDWYKVALSVPIPNASASFSFLLLCGLFLSPVKPKVEEDRAEDVDNDGDDGDDDVEVFEDEEDEEDVEVVEDEEVGEVGEVGRKVEDSSSSFRLVRRLSIGTKLSAALSWAGLGSTEYLSRSSFNGNCWLNEYSASLTKVKVAIVGRFARWG